MQTLHLTPESRFQAESARIARMFGLGEPATTKPKRTPKPRVFITRTPAQQARWNAMVAAWLAEPEAGVRAMRRRFDCSVETVWRAREASKSHPSLAKGQ